MLRGQGDQWDNRARARGVTASFSLNGIGLVPEGRLDPYQENEELKVTLAARTITSINFKVFIGTQNMTIVSKFIILMSTPRSLCSGYFL